MSHQTQPPAARSYDLTDRVVRSETAEAEGSAGETLVRDLDSGRSFSLGEVGGFIWGQFDGHRDLEAIAEAVSDRFEVSAEEAGQDLLEFTAMLADLGLIEVTAAD